MAHQRDQYRSARGAAGKDDPFAQPSSVEPGSTDTRVLGLRFIQFAVR